MSGRDLVRDLRSIETPPPKQSSRGGIVDVLIGAVAVVVIRLPDYRAGKSTAKSLATSGGRTPSTQPSSMPTFDREALSARVKTVLMKPDAMVGLGVEAKQDDHFDTGEPTSEYCNEALYGGSKYRHVAHLRVWQTSNTTVYNYAHGYGQTTGKDAVADTRRSAQTCTTFSSPHALNEWKFELLDVVDLGAIAGVDDSYGRCERLTVGNNPPQIVCEAYLGRGQLLSKIMVFAGDTVPLASARLRLIVPIAAAALAAA